MWLNPEVSSVLFSARCVYVSKHGGIDTTVDLRLFKTAEAIVCMSLPLCAVFPAIVFAAADTDS